MSRYIELNKVLSELGLDHKDYVYIDKHEVAERIKKLPSIDIVRCKECKWWVVAMDENNTDEDYLKCNMDKWTDADDFCSYGEVSEKPNSSEKPNNSTISKMEQVEDEPQTERSNNADHIE